MGGGSNADDFYTLASARQAYKNHLKVVTSRKNSVNGKVRSAPAAFFQGMRVWRCNLTQGWHLV